MALHARVPLGHGHVPNGGVVWGPLIRAFPGVAKLLCEFFLLGQTLGIGPVGGGLLFFMGARPRDVELEDPGGWVFRISNVLSREETKVVVRVGAGKIQGMEAPQEESLFPGEAAFDKGGAIGDGVDQGELRAQ